MLQESLHDLLETVQKGASFATALQWQHVDEGSLTEDKKITFYRIAQEQLNNIVKYANAKSVSISVTQKNTELLMQICDDGVGFDPEQNAKGIGFRNMETREEIVNGKMDLDSNPGKGCQLKIYVSLESGKRGEKL